MKNRKIYSLLLCLLPLTAWALSDDRDQPIQIQADRASLDDLKGITVYEGNVEVIQGSMRLHGDKVTLTYDADKQVEKIIAEGNPARFKQRPDKREEDIQAEARRMEYDAKQDMLHLITQAQVWQGKDRFSGQHIVYDAQRSVITAEGDSQQRVTVVIEPKKLQKPEEARKKQEQE